jgi:hypothetical protein
MLMRRPTALAVNAETPDSKWKYAKSGTFSRLYKGCALIVDQVGSTGHSEWAIMVNGKWRDCRVSARQARNVAEDIVDEDQEKLAARRAKARAKREGTA